MLGIKLQPWASRRLHGFFTAVCYGAGWLLAYVLWGAWANVVGQRLPARGGQLLLSRHLTHVDPFLAGSCAWRFGALLRHPSLVLWFVADRRRFRTPVARFLLSHWRCIPTNRDSHAEMARAYRLIGQTLAAGGNVWLAPGAKLESAREPLAVDPLIGFLIYHFCRQAELVAVRLGGLPVWDGVRLADRGWPRRRKLWHVFSLFSQTLGRRAKVEFVPLDVSDLLVLPEGRATYAAIAERIRRAVAAEPGTPTET